MKILFIGNFFNESYSMNIYANELFKEFNKSDLDIELFQPRKNSSYIIKLFYKYFYFPFIILNRSKDKAIVHIGDQSYAFLSRYFKYLNKNIKIVITCHDIIPYYYAKDLFNHSLFGSISNYLWRASIYSLKYAHIILSDSNYTRGKIIQYLNIESSRIRVVYLGTNQLTQNQTPSEILLAKLKLYENKKLLLSVGSNETRKNLNILIDVLKLLNRNKNDFVLLRVGENISKEQEQTLRNYDQLSNVVQLGKLSSNDLKYVFEKSHIFLFPSFEEGFGLPCLEAMNQGVPVIASYSASIPEIVGNAGILVDPFNADSFVKAIYEIGESDNKREELVKAGYERVKIFTWRATASNVIEIYNLALNGTLE